MQLENVVATQPRFLFASSLNYHSLWIPLSLLFKQQISPYRVLFFSSKILLPRHIYYFLYIIGEKTSTKILRIFRYSTLFSAGENFGGVSRSRFAVYYGRKMGSIDLGNTFP